MYMAKKKKTNCYIYTCVSTAMQVDGFSLDAQRDKLKRYAGYEEMDIIGEYSDEGHSGKNIAGRPEFMKILENIEEGKDDVGFVLVFKLSRFGRNAADVLNSLQLMQSFVDEVQIYKEKNDRGRFLKSISFKFTVYYKGKEIRTIEAGEEGLQEYAEGLTKENLEGWDKEKTDETVVLLCHQNIKKAATVDYVPDGREL